eukprot:TRINITY_DN912_c0_g1_i4.p1 TRINITY_DN912_c0_g1~~TRINITY_DN912_c0_g1_i4.p1  ORF type:complete len:331 (+),score=76.47 TRINITY_DN912_c0_g1_i4:123-995(+)
MAIAESCFSLTGAIFVFSSLLISRYPPLGGPFFGILMLSISDMIHALSYIISHTEHDNYDLCMLSGFMAQFSYVGGSLWVLYTAIAVYIHIRAYFPNAEEYPVLSIQERHIKMGKLGKFQLISFFVIWTIALVAAVIPLTGLLGVHYAKGVIGICWVAVTPTMARYLMFYIEQWVLIVIVTTIFIILFNLIPAIPFEEHTQPASRRMPIHIFYFVVMLIAWVPASVNRICESTGHYYPFTEYFQVATLPLWGFMNGTVYFFSRFRPKAHFAEMVRERSPKVLLRVFYRSC